LSTDNLSQYYDGYWSRVHLTACLQFMLWKKLEWQFQTLLVFYTYWKGYSIVCGPSSTLVSYQYKLFNLSDKRVHFTNILLVHLKNSYIINNVHFCIFIDERVHFPTSLLRSLSIYNIWATTPRQGASYSNGCGNFFIALVKSFTGKTYMTWLLYQILLVENRQGLSSLVRNFSSWFAFQWFFKHG